MDLALFTAVYPGVEKYLGEWRRSVFDQTDKDFSLWIALDGVSIATATRAMGGDLGANWIECAPGETVAQVRQRSFARLVDECDAAVMVDSDDLLLPTRIAAARAALEEGGDLTACALRLTDEDGTDLELVLSPPEGVAPEAILPRYNAFGLSNSAYRSDALRLCLPIPPETVLVDWLLATRAWLLGASLSFDRTPRMIYRQHAANTARMRPPFSPEQIAGDTKLVMQHFRLIGVSPPAGTLVPRMTELDAVRADIEAFERNVAARPEKLTTYAEALNRLPVEPLWWSCVAHPLLREMWTNPKEAGCAS